MHKTFYLMLLFIAVQKAYLTFGDKKATRSQKKGMGDGTTLWVAAVAVAIAASASVSATEPGRQMRQNL